MHVNGFNRDVSVVAGGWSVSEVNLNAIPGRIIAINDSCIYLPHWDETVTMDRLWAEYRWDYLHSQHQSTYFRRTCMKHIPRANWPWLHIYDNDNKSVIFSHEVNRLNGSNSAVCGLNRAYQCWPQRLLLFGFDMQVGPNGESHWYPGYPWTPRGGSTKPGRFKTWASEFDAIAVQFEEMGTQVINVSSRSLIKAFQTAHPRELGLGKEEVAA
jgi:hypothetical protein